LIVYWPSIADIIYQSISLHWWIHWNSDRRRCTAPAAADVCQANHQDSSQCEYWQAMERWSTMRPSCKWSSILRHRGVNHDLQRALCMHQQVLWHSATLSFCSRCAYCCLTEITRTPQIVRWAIDTQHSSIVNIGHWNVSQTSKPASFCDNFKSIFKIVLLTHLAVNLQH